MRAPLRSADSPREGVGGVIGSLSALKTKMQAGSAATVLTIGDSTGNETSEWVYCFEQYLSTLGPQSFGYRLYDDGTNAWGSEDSVKVGSAAKVLFWNASVSGSKPTRLLGARRANSIDSVTGTPDFIIVNHGLNVVAYTGGSAPTAMKGSLMMLVEALRLKWPTSPILIVYENPIQNDNTMAPVNAAWKVVQGLYPDTAVLNVYDLFIAAGKPLGYYLGGSPVHPSTPATTAGRGQAVILDLMKQAYDAAVSGEQVVAPAYLSQSAPNLLQNGDFSSWPGAVPASWTAAGGATSTKDTDIIDPLGGAYSLRIEGTAANGYIQQQVSAPALAACIAAGFCTLAFRAFLPAGQPNTNWCRVGITTTPSFSSPTTLVDMVVEGGWLWGVATFTVPSDATGLFVRLYGDLAANAGGSKAYFGRACLVAGETPRQAAIVRNIEVAGAELFNNGRFETDISGWTDASSVGGSFTFNATRRARAANVSATARGRQNPPIVSGRKYLFHGQGFDATANGSITVGTSLGAIDIFSQTVNASILARWLQRTFVASTSQAFISLLAGVAASSVDYGGISLRELIMSEFVSGRWFEIDFADFADRDDGLPDTPEGIPLRQINTTNGTQVPLKIEGGKLLVATKNAGGGADSASYPFFDLGDAIVTGIRCDLSWVGDTASSVAMVSMAKTGADAAIANVVANSVHNVLNDTYVDIGRYVGSAETVEQVAYASPAVRDGRIYEGLGWTIDGPDLNVYCPNDQTLTRDAAAFTPVLGGIAIAEPYYTDPVAGDVRIHKMRVRIG